jgi:hypothetical protein
MVTKPMPWHDTPMCRALDGGKVCGGRVIDLSENGGGYACGVCGASFRPNAAERAQLERAEAAWNAVLRGEVHEDKACARCGGVLPVSQFRLCQPCVEKDNAERQGVLF